MPRAASWSRFELARGGRAGVQSARVTERLGNPQAQQMTSLIAVHAHGIPDTFPDAVLAEADAAKAPELDGRREDLRASAPDHHRPVRCARP